jgi:formiminoglutamate deiminase
VVEVEGGRFASVKEGTPTPPEDAERLEGLTVPGFANAHSHAFHRALRGRAEQGRGSFWTWRDAMYELASTLDPDGYRALARATFSEMALAGITAVGEFHYLHHGPDGLPYDDPNQTGRALVEAARDAGIRITLLDACYLRGGFDAELSEAQRRFSDGTVDAWAERVDALGDLGAGARVGAAIHSVRAVDPDAAAAVAGWANERRTPLHAHVSEQPGEHDSCISTYGRTPTAVLDDAGALSEQFTAVHFTHADDDDLAALGDVAGCCCLCPTTERDLADGVGRAAVIAYAGASLALGSDSHAVIDPFEEMRALELDQRLITGERGHHAPVQLLRAACEKGHASIGWADAGRIETGAVADLVTVALDGVRMAGGDPEHVLESLVFAAAPADVRRVIVDGRTVVADGRHVGIDVAAELRDSISEIWLRGGGRE